MSERGSQSSPENPLSPAKSGDLRSSGSEKSDAAQRGATSSPPSSAESAEKTAAAGEGGAAERVRRLPPPRPGPPRREGVPRRWPRRTNEAASDEVVDKGPQSPAAGAIPSPAPPLSGPGRLPLKRRELDAQIESELQAVLSGLDLEQSLRSAGQSSPELTASSVGGNLKRGQTVVGRIVAVHGRDVFVDIPGERHQGVVPLEQFEGQIPRPGEEISCRLEHYDAANGLWQLSRQGAAQIVTDWSQLQPHMIVEARVVGVNKQRTGLLVEVAGVKGFLPASQIDLQRVDDLDAWVQQRLKVEIVEVNPAERNLVVSRRAVLERERQQKAETFWAQVEEGQVLRGVVRSVRPFGAFVDLGGADGLLPASELTWQRVEKIEDVVQPGQEVEVTAVRVDREQRKLTLSLKRLTADPWEQWAAQTRPGAVLTGLVTRVTDFGAFVQVAPGIEGLVHISELAPHRVRRPSEVVQPGQQVVVELLSIDPQQRRLSLSMRTVVQRQQEAQAAAQAEEERLDLQEAMERLNQRKPSRPGLRGGIGSEPLPPLE